MFFAKDTIYMDDNLGMNFASEKNIILASNNLDVGSNVKINVSGKSGELVDNSMYGKMVKMVEMQVIFTYILKKKLEIIV